MRMGALLSRMGAMELRREEGARAETYNMLLETEATLRFQRALKRELYFTRAAVLVLVLALVLVLSLGFCLLFYIEFPACKDKGHDGRANNQDHQKASRLQSDPKQPHLDSPNENQDHQQEDASDSKQPYSAYLQADDCTYSAQDKEYVTWVLKRHLVNFTMQDSKSLVVPKDGMYRISLQITYRNGVSKKVEPEHILLSHKVLVYQTGYRNQSRPVLEAYDFVYWPVESHWCKTMYSEVDFIMNQGDIIMVESSNPSYIKCGATSFLSVRHVPTG